MEPQKNSNRKGLVALILVVAVIASLATALLAMIFASQNTVPKGYVPEGYISVEDAKALISSITLPVGSMNMDFQDISDVEADEIANGADELWAAYERNPMGDAVNRRDWGKYASKIATEGMTDAEKTLYNRYDACCKKYLEMGVDGFRGGKSGDYFYYGSEVNYGDLGLSRDQAQSLFYWFKFNNPQYYFLRNGAAYSGTSMFPMMYERFANGNERTKTTNELFDKLDGWIESISDDEVTTWQMELAANDLLCRKLEYDEDEPFYQSMYSAVLLERTVCAGYSETFCAMMNAVGVDAMVALNNIHAWNVVKFDDGNYYVVDVLWNENYEDNDDPKRDYFNVGEIAAKARDGENAAHTFGSDLVSWAPDLSQRDYVPTEYDLTGSGGNAGRLDIPQNLRITDDDGEIAYLAWDSVDGAAQYMVELYTGDGETLTNSKAFEKNETTIRYKSYSSLAVRVRAEDGERVSDWSELFVFTTKADAAGPSPTPTPGVTLAVPKNVKITKDEANSTGFSWDEVAGADQYQVMLFKDAKHTETWVGDFRTKTAVVYNKLQPSTTYYYGVRAMRTVDGEDYYSDWTYFTHKTPEESAKSTSDVTLDAPKNIKIKDVEPGRVAISWDRVEGASWYHVSVFKDSSHKEEIQNTRKFTLSAAITDLEPGTTYYFGIKARSTSVDEKSGQYVYSDWTYFEHTTPAAVDALAAPKNIVFTKDEPTSVRFTWDAVKGAEQYHLAIFKDADHKEIWIDSNQTETNVGYSKLTPGSTYYYGIRAMKTVDGKDYYSDWTYFAHKTPNKESASSVALGAPKNIKITEDEPDGFDFTWDAVEGAEKYQVAAFKDSTHKEIWVDWTETEASSGFGNLSAGVDYHYGVRAVKTVDGKDIYSDWLYFTHKTPAK